MVLMTAMAIHAHNIFMRARAEKDEAEIAAARALVDKRLARIVNPAPPRLPSEILPERRKSPRKSVFLQARLITESLTRIRCQVIDLSADGARVVLDGDHDVTPFVTLRFDRSGVVKEARVAWRYQNELGLAFRAKKTPAETDEEQPSAA